jgi:hypothetical protein
MAWSKINAAPTAGIKSDYGRILFAESAAVKIA